MKKLVLVVASVVALSVLVLVANYIFFQMSSSRISEGKPIVRKNAIRQAVLVIDIQEGLTGTSSTSDFFVKRSQELITNVNRVVDSSAKNDIPVIYVKNEISNPLLNILNDSMAKGTPGAELDSRLRVVSDYVINKDVSDAFSNPLLDSILTKNEINRLVFTGLDLAQCVNSTILAAANRNYAICLIGDALVTDPDSSKQGLLNRFKERGYDVISSKEYCESLR